MPVAIPLIAGAATIGGALISSSASNKAAKAQQDSAALGVAEERRQFDLNRADLAPWRTAGAAAIGQGSAMLQPGYDYTASPGYQWRLNEGMRAVDNGAAARGGLFSGGTIKDEMRFGDGLASSDLGDSFNRQMAIASGGQQAATAGAQLGAQSAGNIANLYTQAGNAKASGYVGSANAINQGIGNLASIFMGGGFGGGFGGGGVTQGQYNSAMGIGGGW